MTTSSQYIIDILKQKYDYEIARREIYDNILNLPIAVLTFVIAGIYFMLQEAMTAYPILLMWLIRVYIIALTGSTVITIHHLYRFYFTFQSEYKGLPSSSDIMDAYETAKVVEDVVSRSFNTPQDDSSIVSQLDEFLIKTYKDSTKENADINDKRREFFTKAKKSLGFTFPFAIVFFLLIVCIKLFGIGILVG